MSIRRKSTTHDLASLRLHPDGSRVQQSSVNSRRRAAGTTVIDSRGNWVAKDAGGKTSVKTRRRISSTHTNDAEGEYIDLSRDEEHAKDARSQAKGKRRARDSQSPDEDPPQEPESGRSNTRTGRRLSFMRDLSFLDPPSASVSSLEPDTGPSDATSAREPVVSFPDPAPDLLKAIHHFASCYYRERGQLSDSSRDYRGTKKERRKQSQENIHTLAANTLKHENVDSENEHTETEDETTEDEDEREVMDAEGSGKEAPRTKGNTYRKDMYKALDGSALMAIGSSTNFGSEAGSTCCRYCAAGVCGTYAFIKTSYFKGTSKPKTEKNRGVA
ncbi:hypothetical protein OG21DRAFT_1417445 [Imleria badia]|nr:hypothetical protein OG21DRAFT_1417445 [Imleria badia]